MKRSKKKKEISLFLSLFYFFLSPCQLIISLINCTNSKLRVLFLSLSALPRHDAENGEGKQSFFPKKKKKSLKQQHATKGRAESRESHSYNLVSTYPQFGILNSLEIPLQLKQGEFGDQ